VPINTEVVVSQYPRASSKTTFNVYRSASCLLYVFYATHGHFSTFLVILYQGAHRYWKVIENSSGHKNFRKVWENDDNVTEFLQLH